MPRETHRHIEKEFTKEGKPICLVPTCNNLAIKHKRSNKLYRNYCANHSFSDMQPFTDWNWLKIKILKRDKYTCRDCGLTNNNLKKKHPHSSPKYDRRMMLHIHHITPICEGGDQWDKNNLITLCISCHNKCHKKRTLTKHASHKDQINLEVSKCQN